MQPESGGFLWFKTGKTVDCYSGVHGCEYIGILAVSRLIQELDPRQMKGEVVFLPIANEGGFYKEIKQLVPEDGVNLNRGISGNGNGKPVSEDSSSCGNVSVSRCGLPRGSP